MASILDQKQEVLNIELTKHGRRLLGLGRFKPEFYSFFDDTIIYDVGYAALQEQQNSSQERLLNGSITLCSLNVTDDIQLAPLGRSSTTNDYAPSWDLRVLNGSINFLQASSSFYENVFDASDIKYYISLEKKNVSNVANFNLSVFELEDGQIINVDDDYILIELAENNVDDDFENFTIEISTFDELAGGLSAGLERKLYFQPKQSNIIDGIIYEESELPDRFIDVKVAKNDVEFYLDVLVDNEIDQTIITKAAKVLEDQVKATYSSTFEGPVGPEC